MTNLHDITLERKLEVFEKLKAETNITEGRFVLLTEEHFDAALVFARDSFTRDEPINRAVGTRWHPELADMWLDTFKCHLTLAVLNDTDEVVALRATRVLDKNHHFDVAKIQDPGLKILFEFIRLCDEKAGFFEHYGVEQAFEFFGFGVRDDYRNHGIGGKLFKANMDFLTYACPDSFCIKGETSSNFSRSVYEKNGFDVLYEKLFDEYLVDGKQVICNTGEHKGLKTFGIRINKP